MAETQDRAPDRISEQIKAVVSYLVDDEHVVTRKELAARMGMTPDGLRQLITGRTAWSTTRLVALEDALDVQLFAVLMPTVERRLAVGTRPPRLARGVTGGYQQAQDAA